MVVGISGVNGANGVFLGQLKSHGELNPSIYRNPQFHSKHSIHSAQRMLRDGTHKRTKGSDQ